MASYLVPICLFFVVLTIVSAVPTDERPFDCPPNEKYYKCELEVCAKTCDHLKHPPLCPAIDPGCFMPACECEDDYLRNSEGKCVPKDKCS